MSVADAVERMTGWRVLEWRAEERSTGMLVIEAVLGDERVRRNVTTACVPRGIGHRTAYIAFAIARELDWRP